MSVMRLVLLFLLSLLSGNLIDYSIKNDNIGFSDKHFVLYNSNATVKKNEIVFDIYRLKFVIEPNQNIEYSIKNIEWIKSDYKVKDFKITDYKPADSIYMEMRP